MTKLILVVSVIVFVGVAGCLAVRSPLVRGLGQDPVSGGMLASSALPAVAVKPAEDMRLVAAGRVSVPVTREGMFNGIPSAAGWYALHANPSGAQLTAILAEAPDRMRWPVNPTFTEHRGAVSLRTGSEERDGMNLSTCTFIRQEKDDPWMPLYAAQGKGWEGPLLVRQYVWRGINDSFKLMIEYREALPADILLPLADDPASRNAFERRADAAFTLLRGDGGNFPGSVDKVPGTDGGEVRRRCLADVLGEVDEPMRLSLCCD